MDHTTALTAITVLVLIIVAGGTFLVSVIREARALKTEYGTVIDVDAELSARKARTEGELLSMIKAAESEISASRQRATAELADLKNAVVSAQARAQEAQQQQTTCQAEFQRKREELSQQYASALLQYNSLSAQVALLEENLDDISFGLYKPHFSFDASEQYKTALEDVRNGEREMIRSGMAASCGVQWTVGNSARDGERMTKQYTKLLLRAFNGECDAAVANVVWNNITKMEERIKKAFEALAQLGSVMQMSISPQYLQRKLDELRLTHEYQQKRHEEREEQRRIREQIREEERAQREMDKLTEDAQREEDRYQKAVEKVREEAARATGQQLDRLTQQVAAFEAKLDEARQKKERAIARAQLTRSGFVYVISNVGSFGDRVFKIGMTRRLEPMERIFELGDASVPFPFDLHAMLYSDNAPDLESALHVLLSDKRVNMVNRRKEFYRDVALEEIERFVRDMGLSAQFIHAAEAQEYRETMAIRAEVENRQLREAPTFAPTLFGKSAGA